MKQLLIFFLMFVGLVSSAFADEISVSLSQKTVSLNDSFSLKFSTKNNVKEQPDFSPLAADFDILSSGQEFSTSLINGVVSKQTIWKLVLIAKHEGSLVIPPIHFGQYSSSPQSIEVTQTSTVKQDESIYLETEISPNEFAYEQTAVIYTVRLYTAVRIAQATLSELKANDPEAIIEQLGRDVELERYGKNGKRFAVIERKYTVIPQRAGELVFSPILFEGQVVTGRNSFFDVQTQYKRIASEPHQLQIKPIPFPFQRSNWLAANDLKLTEEWSADPSQMTLGEPVTWTLKIAADGSLGSQIPTIALNLPSSFKHYLDKPEVSTQETINGIIGSKQVKIALIGTTPGEFELPEIVVKWWDLKSNELKQAILPKRTIKIDASTVAAVPMVSDQSKDIVVPQTLDQQAVLGSSHSLPLWVWILVGINGCVLVGLAFFLGKKISFKPVKPDSIGQIKAALKTACQANDAKNAEKYVVLWAKHIFPNVKPLNIVSIKSRVSEEMQAALEGLHRALYGNGPSWNGETLWSAVKAFKPEQATKKASVNVLRELYPKE